MKKNSLGTHGFEILTQPLCVVNWKNLSENLRPLPVRIKLSGDLISGLVKMKIEITLLTIPNAITMARKIPWMTNL